MAREDKYAISDLKRDFGTDDACLDFLFDTLHSWSCSCGGVYTRLKGKENRKKYQCSRCRFQIAPMSGTIFEKSTTPLTLWFHAIWIFSNAKSGISAKEMERQLGVTYKTAWRILKLIRESLSQDGPKLKGRVEVDEAFVSGRGKGGKYNQNIKAVMAAKSRAIAAIERGGRMRAKHIPDLSAETLTQFVHDNVDPTGTKLYTDESNRYERLMFEYERHSVNHSKKEYARRHIHVNRVESFWSHVKRSIRGTHKMVSKQHLQSYLDAFAFHHDNSGSDTRRFAALLSRIVG